MTPMRYLAISLGIYLAFLTACVLTPKPVGVFQLTDNVGSASGWVAKCTPHEEGYRVVVVTAKHVLVIGDALVAHFPEGLVFQGEVSEHPTLDIALVEFFTSSYVEPRRFRCRSLDYGERLILEGFPHGRGPWMRGGFYSGDNRTSTGAWHGDSGGPISDADGRVVGILLSGLYNHRETVDEAGFMLKLADVSSWLGKELRRVRFTETTGSEGGTVAPGGRSVGEPR